MAEITINPLTEQFARALARIIVEASMKPGTSKPETKSKAKQKSKSAQSPKAK
jgi:hypothetical protein